MRNRAEWYVYELIDPRDDTIFYVGKGKHQRIDDHEWEAENNSPSHKCNKIRSIWAEGLQIGKRKIALFWDEQAAYKCEAERIDEIGLENLTNVLPGGIPAPRKRTKVKRYKPFTPDVAMMVVRNWPCWVAAWLRRPTPNSKLTIKAKGGLYPRFAAVCIEMLVNTLIPPAWQKAISDPKNHAELKSLLQPWNITLVFEPPTV